MSSPHVNELLSAFAPYADLHDPPPHPAKLWGEGSRGIWISDDWGPAVPYGPVDHPEGGRNHGYLRLKGSLSRIQLIPEIEGWPELASFLEIINGDGSPIESVGCEKAYFPIPQTTENGPDVYLGSYVEVVFTKAAANDSAENLLLLAGTLITATDGCEAWWADISMVIEKFRYISGARSPWGLMFQIKNYARGQVEARRFWSESLRRIGGAINLLPANFGK